MAGDAATAALTAVSAVADEAQAKLAAKARMQELEHAVVVARAGHSVDVSPPTRQEALRLVDRMEPGSSEASFIRGVGFILAGVAALTMFVIGGFGWLGIGVPLAILITGGSLGNKVQVADRRRKASQIQLELARASGSSSEPAAIAPGADVVQASPAVGAPAIATVTQRPRLVESGDPRTRSQVLAVLDRLIANVRGLVTDADVATLGRIRDAAARALPPDDTPLNLADHDTWQLRQICIDYLPGALERFLALPSDRASEPLLDGKSARQVLDEQLALIENRLDTMATSSYRREASGLLSHARFIADTLRPDPFQEGLAALTVSDPEPVPVPAPEQAHVVDTHAVDTSVAAGDAATRTRERA
jgi:hypothetical protein